MKSENIIYSIFGLQGKNFIPCKTRQEARTLSKNNKNYRLLDLGNQGVLTLNGVKKVNPPKIGNRYYIAY